CRFVREPEGWMAANREHGFRAHWTKNGRVTVVPDCADAGAPAAGEDEAATVSWELAAIGYDSRKMSAEVPGFLSAQDRELTIGRPGVSEWYRHSEEGLEHGFTLTERPPGSEEGAPLSVDVAFDTGLRLQVDRGRRVVFSNRDGKPLWEYGKLVVFDALGRELPAFMA